MKRDSFWRTAILSGLASLFVAASNGRAQQPSVALANPVLQGADFSFEIVAPDLASCIVECASGIWGEWTELAINPPSPFVIRVGQAPALFRVRCGDTLSTNLAGYFAQIIPREYSMIVNQLDRGGNTLSELFQNPPPGTLLYKFDAVGQAWSAASQFEFGGWTHPNVTLARGEGAFIYAAVQFRHVYHGLCPARPGPVSLRPGWNLTGSTAPAESILDLIGFDRGADVGETVYFYRGPAEFKVFTPSTFLGAGIGWVPVSVVRLGEAFWYSCRCSSPWHIFGLTCRGRSLPWVAHCHSSPEWLPDIWIRAPAHCAWFHSYLRDTRFGAKCASGRDGPVQLGRRRLPMVVFIGFVNRSSPLLSCHLNLRLKS